MQTPLATEYDAIVVGSGITGGWAAKELTEAGLKVLVLERGPEIDPATHYSDMIDPWDLPNLNMIPQDEIAEKFPFYPTVGYAMFNSNKHFWASEADHPYESATKDGFEWVRGYHLGGRSLMWGRASYRWCDDDFAANKRDGHGVDWPVRYADLAPWYDKVETFVGIFVGAVTFTGSVVAYGKLQGVIRSKPLLLPARHLLNLGAVAAWVHTARIRTLNVAGPRASEWPAGYDAARAFVEALLARLSASPAGART